MENNVTPRRTRRLTLEECRIDWNHFPTREVDGTIDYVMITKQEQDAWKEEDCGYSIVYRVGTDTCVNYFQFGYDLDKLKQYYEERYWNTEEIAWRGLIDMFNDGWIKSAAYVDWRYELHFCIDEEHVESFLEQIDKPETRMEILQLIVSNAEYILADEMEKLPFYEYLLSIYQTDLLIRNKNKEDETFLSSYTPQEGNYNSIRLYVEKRLRTDGDFKTYYCTHKFKEVCSQLEKELGIAINVNSLQTNMRRRLNTRKTQNKTM